MSNGGDEASPTRKPEIDYVGLAPVTAAMMTDEGLCAAPDSARLRRTVPMSAAQRRMWLVGGLTADDDSYTVRSIYRLRGRVEVGALIASIRDIVQRHEVLRTTYAATLTGPVATVGPADAAAVAVWPGVAELGTPEAVERESERRASARFDLEHGSLFRAGVAALGLDEIRVDVCAHHIVFDGIARQVFEREVSSIYQGRVAGRPVDLPEPVQYAEYALWEQDWLEDPAARAALDHWTRALAGHPGVLSLGRDSRAEQTTLRGAEITRPLGAAASVGLRRLARSARTTPFVIGLAATAYLLGISTGTDDVLVGAPFSGRDIALCDAMIGCLVQTLPIRVRFDDGTTFAELVNQVRGQVFDALEHARTPFEQIVEALKVERAPGRNPLFQHWFDFNVRAAANDASSAEHGLNIPGVTSMRAVPVGSTTHFDTEIHLYQTGDDFELALTYATEMIEPRFAEEHLSRLRRLLATAGAAPDEPLSTLSLLASDERERVIAASRGPASIADTTTTVCDLVRDAVSRNPARPAVSDDVETVTYAQLWERAGWLADDLRGHGARPESVVAVALPRSVLQIVALVAVARTGAAYLPIDPALPFRRVDAMVQDSTASLLIGDVDANVPTGVTLVAPSWTTGSEHAAGRLPDADAAGQPDEVHRPDNLFYVVFTSGSSGRPKGVAVTDRGVVNLVRWHLRRFGLRSTDLVTQVARSGFDAAAWEIWTTLAAGAHLDIPADAVYVDPPALARHIADRGTTVMFAPTATAEQLLRTGMPGTALRILLTGGDQLRVTEDVRSVCPLANHYGPTEATIVATGTVDHLRPVDAVGIGTPIDGVAAYVLDAQLRPAPDGVPGELFIGGAGVARGYIGRPAETARRFLPDPFSDTPGARIYRTGDRVRRAHDGTVIFLGRVDRQVKVRGLRIEPAEIETAMLSHPDVADAAVELEPRFGEIVGFLVGAAEIDDLRRHLSQQLPAYMIPTRLVRLDEMPTTSSGKIDRARLPFPDDPAGRSPTSPEQHVLAGAWSEVLGRPVDDIDSDFFHIGGHSLLVARLLAEIDDQFGARLPLSTLFEKRTIASQAAAIREHLMREFEAMSADELAAAVRDSKQ